jgi:Cft2 family RNA processing exonuclease
MLQPSALLLDHGKRGTVEVMAKRRHRTAPGDSPAVSWRRGTHITATPIWCDAQRAREVCFVSCAHAVDDTRHGQLIATEATRALLTRQPESALTSPYGRPFTLGTRRLELIQSGHALGSAALAVDVDDRRVLYAGAINPHGGDLGGVADTRDCDAIVVAASYGDARFRFPEIASARAQLLGFAEETGAAGGLAVALVSSASKALDVAAYLAGENIEVLAHRTMHHAAQKVRQLDDALLPPIRRWSGKTRADKTTLLLWPSWRHSALAQAKLPAGSRMALVSGAAIDAQSIAEVGADTGIAWSNQADHDELLAYIDACGATQVYLTGTYAEPLAATLDCSARPARALGPPRQMNLFP